MSNKFNQGVNIRQMADELPAGAERALLRVLSFHTGRASAISRGELVQALKSHGFRLHERAVRSLINELRKQGQPICSTGGEDGGYWLGESLGDVEEFVEREFTSRIMDMLETKKSMLTRAKERWGEGRQEKLF